MENIEVIILAQGPNRLGARHEPPPLQRLPACGDTPIMWRTVRQVREINDGWWPVVVTWDHVRADFAFDSGLACYELAEPGNSALKGIARYLEQRDLQGRRYLRTIVLLGDVVYSWNCLRSIWDISATWGFVGTRDLSLETGELWGVAWHRAHEDRMLITLRDALLRHPLGDEYHPAQLRRWISGLNRGDMRDHVRKLERMGSYAAVDDYTHDIDLPMHLVMLPDLSTEAAADDARCGLSWSRAQEVPMKG